MADDIRTARVVEFHAENFKRLRAVGFIPQRNLVLLEGQNAQGKSSVIDALVSTFNGKGAAPAAPIRAGAQESEVIVTTEELRIIQRFWDFDKRDVLVEDLDGNELRRPQDVLEKLGGPLVDFVEFAQLKPDKQHAQLASLLGLRDIFARLDADRRTAFENRTVVNRDVLRLKKTLESLPKLPQVEPVNVAALLAQIEEIEAHNRLAENDQRAKDVLKRSIEVGRDQASELKAEIEKLLAQLDLKQQLLAERHESNAQLVDQFSAAKVREQRDAAPLKQQIAEAQAINARAAAFDASVLRWDDLNAELAAFEDSANKWTDEIETIDAVKAEHIKKANVPVEGLTFGDGELLLHGQPFAQASQAEQLAVGMEVVMATASAKRLRVIFTKFGSLFDDAKLADLAERAAAKDFQLWVEKVGTTGRSGLIIEDGGLRADPFAAASDIARPTPKKRTKTVAV